MKVLVLSYLYPNSVFPDLGIFVHNRIKAVSKYVDIEVINPIPWSPIYPFFDRYKHYSNIPEQESINGIKVYHPRFFSIPKVGKSVEAKSYYKAVTNLIRNNKSLRKADILDMHWTFPDLPAGLKIAEKLKCKSLITLRGDEAFHSQDGGYREQIVAECLQNVDGIVGVSEHLRERGSDLAENGAPSITIRNGVNVERFPYKEQRACRKLLNLDTDRKIILSIGSLIHRKGFDLIIEALSELKKSVSHSNTHFYIGGAVGHEGDYKKELVELIEQLNLNGHVHFVGQIPNKDLNIWYNAADVFCLASRGEGSPNVLTEALSCGTPAITSDVGAAREIAESAEPECLVVPANDSQAISIALNEKLTCDHDRKLSSKHFNKYSWDWCANKVFDFYTQILNERN